MYVRDVMAKKVLSCTPSDTAQEAARIMKTHGVGALPVLSDSGNRMLEGIVTDRDLCLSVVAEARLAETIQISEIMTNSPLTCAPENTLEDCEKLMQEHQVRRLPVVDNQGRCIGMLAQADLALHESAAKVAKTLAAISRPAHAAAAARA